MPAQNVSMDDWTYEVLSKAARENGWTFSEALRRFVKLGWAHLQEVNDPDYGK